MAREAGVGWRINAPAQEARQEREGICHRVVGARSGGEAVESGPVERRCGDEIAKVRQLANQLSTASKQLRDASNKADHAVKTMGQNWVGADETQFAQQWNPLKAAIDGDADDIQTLSTRANQEATQQEQTSAK